MPQDNKVNAQVLRQLLAGIDYHNRRQQPDDRRLMAYMPKDLFKRVEFHAVERGYVRSQVETPILSRAACELLEFALDIVDLLRASDDGEPPDSPAGG